MKNRMKNRATRLLILVSAIVLTTGLLAGCGDKPDAVQNTVNLETEKESANQTDVSDAESAQASDSAEESIVTEPEIDISQIDKPDSYPVYPLNSETVKLVGRNYPVDDNLWCSLSGSGAEFTYYGEKLDLTFLADSARSVDGSRARVAVYVDDERVLDEMLKAKSETVTVYEGAKKEINVRIVKLSEAAHSAFAVAPITVAQGEYILPAPEKQHRIEFIGDSITCGYGVDDENQDHHFSTATEDATKAWAYKTAELLDADYSLFSYSGWGIISGYTNDSSKKSASQLVPTIYDKLAFSYQRFGDNTAPQDIEWDFSRFVPEAVVINLGTNDASYCDTPEKKQEFAKEYTAFLKVIREKNPDAYLFCALGTMGNELYPSIKDAVQSYVEETGDERVETIALMQQSMADGIAADWHPTEKTHEKTAKTVAHKIQSVLGW